MTKTTTTEQFNGLRMMDVRKQIAVAGQGLQNVEKIDAGHYTITTTDGRTWNVVETPAGMWRGES